MNPAEQYRLLVNKLESIDLPVQEEEQVDELAPALAVGGIAAILAGIKGGSDYLDKVAAAKQAAGNLKPEEVKQLADLINQLEKTMEDPEIAKAVEADKKLADRLKAVSDNAKKLQGQAATASQSTAQTIGGTVGAAVKEPFRQVGKGISAAAGAVGDFVKGVAGA